VKALAIGAFLVLVGAGTAAGALVPTPIGAGPQFHPGATSPAVLHARPVRSMSCAADEVPRVGVHVELFAHGRVVIVPAGIGISPPVARRGAYVVSGRCSYPLRTREPTGVIEVARDSRHTLGDFFAVWGKALSPRRLLGFPTDAERPVRAYVDGRRYQGSPSSIVLRRHAEIVLELGPYVPPHAEFRFRSGL
jgi:hypothetical protein